MSSDPHSGQEEGAGGDWRYQRLRQEGFHGGLDLRWEDGRDLEGESQVQIQVGVWVVRSRDRNEAVCL